MLKKLSSTLSALLCCGTAYAAPLEIGAEVPTLTSIDQDGKVVNLSEEMAKGLTLVYFFPKASTPG